MKKKKYSNALLFLSERDYHRNGRSSLNNTGKFILLLKMKSYGYVPSRNKLWHRRIWI